MISEPKFNLNLDKVCATGIHYFISKEVARNYTGTKEVYCGSIYQGYINAYDHNGKLLWFEEYNKGRVVKTTRIR